MTYADQLDRRDFLKKAAVAGTATAGLGWLTYADLQHEAVAKGRHCKWGALSLKGSSQESAMRALEHQVGRKFDTTHYRMPWDSDLVNKFTQWSAHTGHTPILSWFARTKGGLVSWRGIAQGQHDAWITKQARSLRASGWHGYFCFHKEPEDEGNSTDWKAAYNRVHKIFHNVGVTKFRWVVALMASTYGAGQAGQWLPRNYDLLGVDGYNRYHCRNMAAVQRDLLPGARVRPVPQALPLRRGGGLRRRRARPQGGLVQGSPGNDQDVAGDRGLLLQQRGHRLHLLRGFLVVLAVVVPRDGARRLLPMTVRAAWGRASPPCALVDAGTGLP